MDEKAGRHLCLPFPMAASKKSEGARAQMPNTSLSQRQSYLYSKFTDLKFDSAFQWSILPVAVLASPTETDVQMPVPVAPTQLEQSDPVSGLRMEALADRVADGEVPVLGDQGVDRVELDRLVVRSAVNRIEIQRNFAPRHFQNKKSLDFRFLLIIFF